MLHFGVKFAIATLRWYARSSFCHSKVLWIKIFGVVDG